MEPLLEGATTPYNIENLRKIEAEVKIECQSSSSKKPGDKFEMIEQDQKEEHISSSKKPDRCINCESQTIQSNSIEANDLQRVSSNFNDDHLLLYQNQKQQVTSAMKVTLGKRFLKPLRAIDVVGQLNHSASRGLLLIMLNLVMLALFGAINSASGVSWPFRSVSASNNASSGMNLVQSAINRRWPRNSQPGPINNHQQQPVAPSGAPPPDPAPISRQFHYFWNHDQIDPKTVGNEAQRILVEAQMQTDQVALTGLGDDQQLGSSQRQSNASWSSPSSSSSSRRVTPRESVSSRQDNLDSLLSPSSNSLQASSPLQVAPGEDSFAANGGQAPVILNPMIQQQLTNMVLQMQRQQQMSMLMQPRFDAIGGHRRDNLAMAPPNLLNSPVNPMSRYWMSTAASNQQPVIAAPPPPPPQVHPFSNMMAASAPAGTMAGVPIYGPFMVAPSIMNARGFDGGPMAMGQQLMSPVAQVPGGGMAPVKPAKSSSNQHSTTSRFASSLLGRRKHSWPSFQFASGLGQAERASSGLRASGSQLRPVVVPPFMPAPASISNQLSTVQQQQQQQQQQLGLNLPPETATLIDVASSRLADAIANQVQSQAAQQGLIAIMSQEAAAFARAAQPGSNDAIQGSSSMPIAAHQVAANPKLGLINSMMIHEQQRQAGTLQPPYSLVPSTGGSLIQPGNGGLSSYQPSSQFAYGVNPLIATYQQSMADMLLNSLLNNNNNGTNLPYGSRLKRRHLNGAHSDKQTSNVKTERKRFPVPPYSVSAMMDNDGQVEPKVKQYHYSKYNQATQGSKESFEGLASMQVPVVIKSLVEAIPSQKKAMQSSTTRIVKKDASNMEAGGQLKNETLRVGDERMDNSKKNLKHLFMLVPSENSVSDDLIDLDTATPEKLLSVVKAGSLPEKQTQLRRLKRSSSPTDGNSMFKSSSWSSIESPPNVGMSKKVDDISPIKVVVLTKPQSTTNWIPKVSERVLARSDEALDSPAAWSAATWPRKSAPMPSVTTATPSDRFMAVDASSNAAALLRRQAELGTSSVSQRVKGEANRGQVDLITVTTTSGELSTPTTTENSVQVTSQQNQEATEDEFANQRQGKAFKIKRVASSASVMHHPISKFIKDKTKNAFKRGIILVGAPVNLGNNNTAKVSNQSNPASVQYNQPDPMAASLSESTRVVNYFQNVENEQSQSSSQRQDNSEKQQPVTQASTSGPQSVQVNLAFGAPNSKIQQQNETQYGGNQAGNQEAVDLKRQHQQQQQQFAPSGKFITGHIVGNEHQNVNNRNLLTRTNQHSAQQSRVNAGSADISSAATRNLAFVNNMQIASGAGNGQGRLQSSNAADQQGIQGGSGFTAANQPARFAASNKLKDGLFALQGSIISSLSSMDSPNSNQRTAGLQTKSLGHSSINQNAQMLSASKQALNQQQPGGPNGSGLAPAMAASNHERSTMADQSINYNTEYLPPPPVNLYGSSASSGVATESGGLATVNQNDNGQPFRESFEPLMNEQQNLDSSSANLLNNINDNQANGVNANNNYEPGRATDLEADQFASKQFNQQQQQQQQQQFGQAQGQFSQVDNNIQMPIQSQQSQQQQQQFLLAGQPIAGADQQQQDAVSESSVTYNPTNNFGTGVGFSHLDSQLNAAAAQGNQQMLPSQQQQQQLYSDQLIALGNAVSNYNRRRFNQLQLQENAMRGPFQQLRNPSQLVEVALSNVNSNHQHYPLQSNQFPAVDEEAAAGTLAAAGIPTYPGHLISQLQSQGGHLGDLSNLLMAAGSEQARSEQSSDDSAGGDSGKGSNKKGKKKNKTGKQQVSHHYHFNSFGSPFEDIEGQLGPSSSPLEFGAALESFNASKKQQQLARQRAKANKQNMEQSTKNENEQDNEEEQEKPKKKGLLRRFSLRNLFKKFKKDKKKKTPAEESDSEGGGGGGGKNNAGADGEGSNDR